MNRRDILKTLPFTYLSASLLDVSAAMAIGQPLFKLPIYVTNEDPALIALKYIKIKNLDIKKGIDLKIIMCSKFSECEDAIISGTAKFISSELLFTKKFYGFLETISVIPHFTQSPILTSLKDSKITNISYLQDKDIGVTIDRNSLMWKAVKAYYLTATSKHIEEDVNLKFATQNNILSLFNEKKLQGIFQILNSSNTSEKDNYHNLFLFHDVRYPEFLNLEIPFYCWYIKKDFLDDEYPSILKFLIMFRESIMKLKNEKLIWINVANKVIENSLEDTYEVYKNGIVNSNINEATDRFNADIELLESIWNDATEKTNDFAKLRFFKK